MMASVGLAIGRVGQIFYPNVARAVKNVGFHWCIHDATCEPTATQQCRSPHVLRDSVQEIPVENQRKGLDGLQ